MRCWLNPLSGSGTVLVERYRLDAVQPDPLRGSLWRAVEWPAICRWPGLIQPQEPAAADADLHLGQPRGELVELDGAYGLCAGKEASVLHQPLLHAICWPACLRGVATGALI